MKVLVNRQLAKKLTELYEASEEFMKPSSIDLMYKGYCITYSVCFGHKVTANDFDYFTLNELYRFYDNYSKKQINEMKETNQFPLKLTSLISKDGKEKIGIETEMDGNLMELNEIIVMFDKELKRLI